MRQLPGRLAGALEGGLLRVEVNGPVGQMHAEPAICRGGDGNHHTLADRADCSANRAGYIGMFRHADGDSHHPGDMRVMRCCRGTKRHQIGFQLHADAHQPRRATSQTATKLTYRDKYALEKLPEEMEALRGEIAAYQKQLDDPTLYARDAEQFATWAEKLSQARDRLEKAEEEWLALEIRREEIESSG